MRSSVLDLASISLVFVALPFCHGQDASYPLKPEHSTAVVRTDLLVIASQVVSNQWPQTLPLVNAPLDLQALESGQCVRFGITVTGDDRDRLLQNSKFAFEIQFTGKTEMSENTGLEILKHLKLDGGDFVTNALGVAGIKNPILSFVSVGVPAARWCVPSNAPDGIVRVKSKVTMANGKNVVLTSRSILVKTFITARKTTPFKTPDELGAWLQSYHFAPDPAQLLPALRVAAADEKMRSMPIIGVFLASALKTDPFAANEIPRSRARTALGSKLCFPLAVAGWIQNRAAIRRSTRFGTDKHSLSKTARSL